MSLSARIVSRLLEDGASDDRIQFVANQLGLPVDQVRELDQYDPTNGKYLSWIAKMAKSEVLRFPEDGDKTRSTLDTFRSLSRKPNFKGERDLNRYRSYGQVVQANEENGEVKTKGEIVRAAEQEGVMLLKTMGEDKLFQVTSPEAAARLFRHTEWCVKDPKYFNKYNPKRFYYVERNGKPFVLFHPESNQTKDAKDNRFGQELPILDDMRLSSPKQAYMYALDVLGTKAGRFKKSEPVIARDPELAYRYAVYLTGDRFELGERSISKNPRIAYLYARDVIGGRWPEAEPAVRMDPDVAYRYAIDVVKGRWVDGENSIRRSPHWHDYVESVYGFKRQTPEKLPDYVHTAKTKLARSSATS